LVDVFVLPKGSDQFEIAEYGSFSALRRVIEAYHHQASAIYYPFPRILWEPHPPALPIRLVREALTPPASGPVDGESMNVLAVSFTRAQLMRAPTSSKNTNDKHVSNQ
jgi:hypothetical protein